MGNGKKDDVSDPTTLCQQKKGALLAEVMSFRSGSKKAPRLPVKAVPVKIAGPTKMPDKNTGDSGRTDPFQPLDPGDYTASITFSDDQWQKYDVDSATTSKTKNVPKCKTVPYSFEVQSFWLEHEVVYPNDKLVPNIDYVLRRKKITRGTLKVDDNWSVLNSGTTTESKVTIDPADRGNYQLDLKLVTDPSWSKDKATIGEAIDLKASVSGFDAGTAGSFDIYDATDLTKSFDTVAVNVTEDTGKRQLKTSWTPAADKLKDLKHGRIVFRAKVNTPFCFSAPIPLFTKEKYEVVDEAGTKINAHLKLRFSGGDTFEGDANAGAVDVLIPWGQTLARLDSTDHKGQRVTIDEGGLPARAVTLPK